MGFPLPGRQAGQHKYDSAGLLNDGFEAFGDRGGEVGFDLPYVGEFGEGPAAVGAQVVHAGYPVGLHGAVFVFGVFAPEAFDFHHEVQGVFDAHAVVDEDDEVREVAAIRRGEAVGDFEAQVVVLGVGENLGVGFGGAAELGFPVAVQDDVVHGVLRRGALGVVAFGFPGGESHVFGGPGGVVGIEDGVYGASVSGVFLGAVHRVVDAAADLFHEVGIVHEQGGVGAAFADEVGVHPFGDDALEGGEEMEGRGFSGVAKAGGDEVLAPLPMVGNGAVTR